MRIATPVRIEPNELSGGNKGLVEYGPQTNFPNPWPGGSWRLRDIMDYERIASDAILESCAERRSDFLKNALARAQDAVATFDATDAFRIPALQRDAAGAARLAALLAEHGVELRAAANGDVYVPLAQPYGRFVKEMLDGAALPRDQARRRQGDRAALRRVGLDAAADDGRERRARDARRVAPALDGRGGGAAARAAGPSRSPPAAPRPRGS